MKLLALIFTLLPAIAFAATTSPFKNINQIQSQLGFNKYYSYPNTKTLKVAVLDKGFQGFENEIGKTLPASTRYIAGPVNDPENVQTEHGLRMAQIMMALMTNSMQSMQFAPELTLYNVFGYSNFKAAIDDAINNKVDVILYSEVWEYGGNFDGQGFFNEQVNRATNAGIVWINAAGNFALTTYNSGINTLNDKWVDLPNQNHSIMIRCQAKECATKIVLSWNDFKNDVSLGTDKDLDLALTDDLLNIIEVSSLRQSNDPNESRPGFSKYPREIISAKLSTGTYFIRVKNQSQNFNSSHKLRITVDGNDIEMPSHSLSETLLNPADNASVITVGASDSAKSSTSDRLNKPDIFAPSSIIFENGAEFRGSSNSAAIVAAGVALIKSLSPADTKEIVLSKIRSTKNWNWNQPGLSLQLLGFMPTVPGCFAEAQFSPLPAHVSKVLNQGGVLVQTTAAMRVMVPFDPIMLAPNLRRGLMNDMIVTTPRGYEIYPRGPYAPPDAVEVFQRPLEAGLCNPPAARGSKSFYMP